MEGKVVSSRFKRVCVFCGSSTGKRNCYRDAAIELAQELVLLLVHLNDSPFMKMNYNQLVSVFFVTFFFNFFISISFSTCSLEFLWYIICFLNVCEGVKEAGPCLWRWEYWANGSGFTSCASWWGQSSWVLCFHFHEFDVYEILGSFLF